MEFSVTSARSRSSNNASSAVLCSIRLVSRRTRLSRNPGRDCARPHLPTLAHCRPPASARCPIEHPSQVGGQCLAEHVNSRGCLPDTASNLANGRLYLVGPGRARENDQGRQGRGGAVAQVGVQRARNQHVEIAARDRRGHAYRHRTGAVGRDRAPRRQGYRVSTGGRGHTARAGTGGGGKNQARESPRQGAMCR